MKFKRATIICLCLCFLLLFSGAAVAAAGSNGTSPGTAVLVVIDRVTVEDLVNNELPNIKKISAAGAIGLMTTNPAAGVARTPENTYTTIGAGFKLKGGFFGGLAYNESEPYEAGTAGDAYFRRTGRRPAPGSVVHLGIVDILKSNSDLKYNYTIGSIGEALHRHGKKTAVIGNTDVDKEVNRHVVNIAMDSLGLVDFGDVGSGTMVKAPDRIAGRKPDYPRWLHMLREMRSKAALIVIETAETSMLDKMTDISLTRVVQQERKKILHELDGFIGSVAEQLDWQHDLLMIIVPEPTFAGMAEQNYLTPVIVAGKGIAPGLLWSGTIKRNGLVANTDIAPTVASFFGISNVLKGEEGLLFNGQAIESRPGRADFKMLSDSNKRIVYTNSLRYPLVKGYINTVLVILLVVIIGLLLRQGFVRRLKPALMALTAVPLALLLQSIILPQPRLVSGIIAALGLTLLISLFGYILGRKNELGPFVVIALFTAITIIIDLFIGAPLNKTSPLSYDPMTGARFYGLGNEYMGVLLGALIAGLTGLVSVCKLNDAIARLIIGGVFLLGIYVIVAPELGTNVGGGIAAVAGFGAVMLVLAGYTINRKTLLTLALGIGLMLGLFLVYDMNRSQTAQTHIGRTVSLIRETGAGEILNIITRKAAMNWKLIKRTTWSWTFLTGLAGFIIFNTLRPVNGRKIKADYPYFHGGMTGMIIGALAALLFNDSGVVAAATMISFGAAPYLTLIINREEVL